MILSDLRSMVRSLTGVPSTAILSDATLNTYINETYRDVCTAYDWPFLTASTTVSTAGYDPAVGITLPAGVRENRVLTVYKDVVDSTRRQLSQRSRFTVHDQSGSLSSGTATEYVLKGGKLFLFPLPESETLTIDYVSVPTTLTDSAGFNTPVFYDEYHSMLAYGAAVRVLIAEGDETERRGFYRAQYVENLERMRVEYMSNRDKSTMRFGGRMSNRRIRNTRNGQ